MWFVFEKGRAPLPCNSSLAKEVLEHACMGWTLCIMLCLHEVGGGIEEGFIALLWAGGGWEWRLSSVQAYLLLFSTLEVVVVVFVCLD